MIFGFFIAVLLTAAHPLAWLAAIGVALTKSPRQFLVVLVFAFGVVFALVLRGENLTLAPWQISLPFAFGVLAAFIPQIILGRLGVEIVNKLRGNSHAPNQ